MVAPRSLSTLSSATMHTAMRLALSAARRVRREHPGLPICFYGLYATVSRELVERELAARAIAGEYEPALTAGSTDWQLRTSRRPPTPTSSTAGATLWRSCALHERRPELTFDCTTKVEHVLEHAEVWEEMAASGCLFVVCALDELCHGSGEICGG